MESANLLMLSTSVAAALFGILCAITGWVGSRVVTKQDEIMIKLDEVKDDLHNRINDVDRRLIRVETLLYEDDKK